MSQPFHLCPDLENLHRHERLNYVLGQVLGVKDFQQEQTYFLHQNRLHNRSLHGYGTVWGLAVSTAKTGDEFEVQVAPGLAIDAQGREVWVDAIQCAQLNAWLGAAAGVGSSEFNWQTLTPITEEPPADEVPDIPTVTPLPGEPSPEPAETVAVYVTLCYHPCQAGAQPVLGNPCRSDTGEEGVIQYTRIRDEFELQLRAKPPLQIEEDWVRRITALLARLDLDPGLPDLDEAALVTLTNALRDGLDHPARIPDLGPWVVPQQQAENLLRELFRYWVTHTRPTLDYLHNPVVTLLDKIAIDDAAVVPSERAIAAQIQQFTQALDDYEASNQLTAIEAIAPVAVPGPVATRYHRAILQHWSRKPIAACPTVEDDCILLAAIQFRLTAEGTVDETPSAGNPELIKIEDLQRPYLLHTRLIQELALQAFIQNSVDELALGAGTARYSAPNEGDVDGPGVFPAETMPDGVNVAFDVVVPNPILYGGDALYAKGDESSGVIPIEPLPDVSLPDGTTVKTNVAFNVVVPHPEHGLGEVRFSSGAGDAPRVEESTNPVPPDADVAFDVILPELGEGRVFLEGSDEAVAADINPPLMGVYPRSSTEGSEKIAFDVVIPTSPSTAPTLGNGSVWVEGTPDAGGSGPGVYPAATAAANVAFNVVIPQAQSENLLPPVMLRPSDMVLLSTEQLTTRLGSVIPARLADIRGYPALVFPAPSSQDPSPSVAGFSILRPVEVTSGMSAALRLYCTALQKDQEVSWQVFWRWVRSIPAERIQNVSDSELLQIGSNSPSFDTLSIDMSFVQANYYLHASDSTPLVNIINFPEDADYLMVYLLPKFDFSGDGDDAALYLLMAELRWEVA